MSNLNKFRKSTVAILTALLIISIAAPLASFATAAAAPTASLDKVSGPNGTLVQVQGTGFKPNQAYTANPLTGIALTYDGAAVGPLTEAVIAATYQLSTDGNGVLTGYFVIYGLNAGPHTIMISDPASSVVAGVFTITVPTVTLTPTSGVAGTSVLVSASGFPTSNATIEPIFTNSITDAQFSGTSMTIAVGGVTATSTDLSSDIIAQDTSLNYLGTYTGTVSLGNLTAAGPSFTLTDSWGNTATTELSATAPTVTLSPNSGPVGTWVTATVSGFGPSSAINTVKVGNGPVTANATASVTPVAPVTTEQGTSVFLFQIPDGAVADKAGAAGAQKVSITDLLGNKGTATFTVTPKATITLGAGSPFIDSTTTSVPVSTVAAVKYILSGFKANTELTISGSPGIPSEWITPSAVTWSSAAQISANSKLKTDANGQIAAVISAPDSVLDYPVSIGQYTITISDGTNSVTTTINVVPQGDILAIPVTSGAAGQTGVSITYFGTHTPASASLQGAPLVTSALNAPSAWPTPQTATFTVPQSTPSGVRTFALAAVGGTYNTVGYTVVSQSVSVISPSSAAVGTTVTVVGTGYATGTAVLAIQGATITPTPANMPAGTNLLIATFAVPNYLPGTYTLTVSDTALNTATTSITVTSPTIQITPTASILGNATLAITGSGFKANDGLTIKFDNTPIGATTPVGLMGTNTNGGIIICSGFDVPTAATAGTHTVSVAGSTGAYATATFTVTPSLTDLAAVRPGAKVVITGSGFAMNSLQTLTVNGTATTWLDLSGATAASINQAVVLTNAVGTLYTGVAVGFTLSATQAPGTLVVEVKDASGNTASTILTVLGTPAIAVGTTNVVAGTAALSGVSISGTGFTPTAPGTNTISAKLYSGSTLVTTVPLSSGTVVIQSDGSFAVAAGITFAMPSTVAAGTYTLRITVGLTEIAETTVTVLSAPTIIAPTTAASGSNVTITITGLTAMSTTTFNGVPIAQFGPTTVLNTGESAYTETTWFVVPTNLFAGTYLLIVKDTTTTPNTAVQAAITVTPSISVTPTVISKGSALTVSGTGFATGSALTATVNGQAVTLGVGVSATAAGAIPAATTITVPVTSLATNTLTVTDALGNSASATFNLTTPKITLTPTSTGAGNTVQIIGSGFTAFSPIVIQVGSQVVTTVPAALAANAGGDFISYITVPAGLSGDVTVTATDNSNNVGTTTLTVGGSTGQGVPSQTTMSSTAQTTTPSGTATTAFTAGSTVKASFVLQSTSGSRDVVVAVTWQQGAKVYSMASFQTTMTTTASTMSFSNLIPAGATGTWTATLQVFASDGVTPLGVTTLTFTVS